MKIAVTGRPGIGKTTFCLKVYEALKDKLDVRGFITLEVREKGVRIGFKLVDLVSNEEAWLAKVGHESKFKVGKYGVFVDSIDRFAEKLESYADADFVILDEVGPMELKSRKFVRAVENLMRRDGLLFSIHLKSQHPLLRKIRNEFEVITLTEENRDTMAGEVIERILAEKNST